MPELPEVEVTCRGVEKALLGGRIEAARVSDKPLRWPLAPEALALLPGQHVRGVRRRGKYLLIQLDTGTLIVHLGMSGSFRVHAPDAEATPWDHFFLTATQGRRRLELRLCDPRRFGAVVWHANADGPVGQHPLLVRLGMEPFDPGLDAATFQRLLRTRRAAIKLALMDGHLVVGVGNIYASEALFRAGIRPTTSAARLSLARCAKLLEAVRATLQDAIDRGGSTLRNFVGSDGMAGHFQHTVYVYDRAGQSCRVCGTPVRHLVQGQRSTYYCACCQR